MPVFGGWSPDVAVGGTAGAYDPASDTWRAIAPVPYDTNVVADAVWADDELLVLSGDGALQAYDPDADPPLPGFERRTWTWMAWTGTELLIGGGVDPYADVREPTPVDAAAYDPANGTWRVLPDSPVRIVPSDVGPEVWTGTEVVLWEDDGQWSRATGRPVLLNPATGAWRVGPASPDGGRQQGARVWTGSQMLWWSGEPTASDADPASCCWPDGGGLVFTP